MAFTDKILSPLLSPLKRALKERSGAIPKLVQTGAEQLGLTKSMKTFSDFFERGPRVKPSVRPPAPIQPAPVVPPKRRDDDVMTASSAPMPKKTPVVAAPPKSDIQVKAPAAAAPTAARVEARAETFADLAEKPGALEPTAQARPAPVPMPMPKAAATKKRAAAKAKPAAAKAKPAAARAKPAAAKKAAPAKKKPTAAKAKPAAAKKAAPAKKKPAATPSEWPLLSAAAKKQKLVLAGGIPKKPVQTWLEGLLGSSVHWTDTSSAGTRSVAGLELAIQRGGVAALVLLEGSISHTESERIIAACKKAKVPLARGKRGGRQSLRDALATLEKALKKLAN